MSVRVRMKRLTQSYARRHAGDFNAQQEETLQRLNEWAASAAYLMAHPRNRQRWFEEGARLRHRIENTELGALDFAKLDEFITEQLERRNFRLVEPYASQ